jgi:hypothetical protein
VQLLLLNDILPRLRARLAQARRALARLKVCALLARRRPTAPAVRRKVARVVRPVKVEDLAALRLDFLNVPALVGPADAITKLP